MHTSAPLIFPKDHFLQVYHFTEPISCGFLLEFFCLVSSLSNHISSHILILYSGHIGLFPDTWIFLFLCLYPCGSLFPSTLYLSVTTPSYIRLLLSSLRSLSPLSLNFWGHSWYHRHLSITFSPTLLAFLCIFIL